MDGTYRPEGRRVFRRATQTPTGVKMGFPVCELHEMINDTAASIIAEALNMHLDAFPEKHGVKSAPALSDLDGLGQSDGRSDKIT